MERWRVRGAWSEASRGRDRFCAAAAEKMRLRGEMFANVFSSDYCAVFFFLVGCRLPSDFIRHSPCGSLNDGTGGAVCTSTRRTTVHPIILILSMLLF